MTTASKRLALKGSCAAAAAAAAMLAAGPALAEAPGVGLEQSLNMAWVLIGGFLVMFMQVGFAMLETGFTRSKNAVNTMGMNLIIYPIGVLGFWLIGYAFMMGGVSSWPSLGAAQIGHHELALTLGGRHYGILGLSKFALISVSHDPASLAMFLFAVVFMDTAATIPTGAMAERWKFSAFFVYGLFMSMILYPLYGNWVWGGGWLAQLGVNFGLGHGHLDFAGSSVVHMQGGVISLVFAYLIGPRYGKYNKDGSINPIAPHSIAFVMVGTFILAFGWFGFNPGSTLAGTDFRLAVVAVNTMIAGSTGALAATLWVWFVRSNKPDPSMMANGMLAGLVAITAPCAFVGVGDSAIIGLIAGVLVVESVFFFDRKKIDDPVGAISVHGVNGAWGCLSIGLFADGTYGDGLNGIAGNVTGLFYGGGFSQLAAESIGVLTCFIFVGSLSYVVYKVIDKIVGHRVALKDEIDGLDLPEMGIAGYNGFVMDKYAETHHPKG